MLEPEAKLNTVPTRSIFVYIRRRSTYDSKVEATETRVLERELHRGRKIEPLDQAAFSPPRSVTLLATPQQQQQHSEQHRRRTHLLLTSPPTLLSKFNKLPTRFSLSRALGHRLPQIAGTCMIVSSTLHEISFPSGFQALGKRIEPSRTSLRPALTRRCDQSTAAINSTIEEDATEVTSPWKGFRLRRIIL